MTIKHPIFSQLTHDVRVSVRPAFLPEYSTPERRHFVFSYSVLIENLSPARIQLLSRRWYVVDIFGDNQTVEGKGVVGKQPILAPGEKFEYVSGTKLQSEFGKMYGSYQMQRLADGHCFWVDIPEFPLLLPDRCQ
ncbi:MAG: Co2+/Mg2+ efflux protein ApaG [Bernardetiaceae bacterium]